jgi:hypothetical protein
MRCKKHTVSHSLKNEAPRVGGIAEATVGITLDTYSHVTPWLKEEADRRFEEGLLTPSQGAPLANG